MLATSALPQTPSFRVRNGARKLVRVICLWWLISSLETPSLIDAPWSRGGEAS